MVLAERARLSREIHDTLLQSLVGVALQFDAISNTLDSSSSGARHQLVRIRRQVEAYIREARQSIWDLRSPVLETHDLHAALREFGKRAAAGKPGAFRRQRHGNAAPVLGQGGESAAAHRAGSDYQRRPARRCEAH